MREKKVKEACGVDCGKKRSEEEWMPNRKRIGGKKIKKKMQKKKQGLGRDRNIRQIPYCK